MVADQDSSLLRKDEGSALILVLMVMALVMALGSTVAVVTISDLQAARRASEAGQVLNAAEAGLAQGISYIRENGVGGLKCGGTESPSSADCTKVYGSGNLVGPPATSASPARYQVWVEEVVHFSPRTQTDGLYVIHSTGSIATDNANRSITSKVQVSSFGFPHAVFARDFRLNGNGTSDLVNQSIFTASCFVHRNGLNVSGTDPFLGIPAGVHSSKVITTGSANSCEPGKQDSQKIHFGQRCNRHLSR